MKNLPTTEERIWAVLAHLSALSFGMGIVLPIIGWSEQRRKSKYASLQCLQALGYQSLGFTVWILIGALFMLILVFSMVISVYRAQNSFQSLNPFPAVIYFLMLGLFGVYFLLPILAAIGCALGRDFHYPMMGDRLARYLEYGSSKADDQQTWLNEDHEDRWVTAMGHFSVIIAFWGMLAPLAAWVLQGKRSLFLKFQSIQTLVYQVFVTLLLFGAGAAYLVGFIPLMIMIGVTDGKSLSTTDMGTLIILAIFQLFVSFIFLIIPLFHILGQWAGYRVLKGDEYHYPILGKLVEKRLSSTVLGTDQRM